MRAKKKNEIAGEKVDLINLVKNEKPVTFKIYPSTHKLLVAAHLAEMLKQNKAISFIQFTDGLLKKALSCKKK